MRAGAPSIMSGGINIITLWWSITTSIRERSQYVTVQYPNHFPTDNSRSKDDPDPGVIKYIVEDDLQASAIMRNMTLFTTNASGAALHWGIPPKDTEHLVSLTVKMYVLTSRIRFSPVSIISSEQAFVTPFFLIEVPTCLGVRRNSATHHLYPPHFPLSNLLHILLTVMSASSPSPLPTEDLVYLTVKMYVSFLCASVRILCSPTLAPPRRSMQYAFFSHHDSNVSN